MDNTDITIIVFGIIFAIIALGALYYEQNSDIKAKQKQGQALLNQLDQMLRSWVGASIQELSVSWGPPTNIFNIDANNKIWIYVKSEQIPGSANIFTFNQHFDIGDMSFTPIIFTPPSNVSLSALFYVDKKGKIYASNYKFE